MNALTLSFLVLGVLSVLLALFVITRKNPVSAAVLLIVDFVLFAAMYGMLDAHFSAVSQIIVYAGAIMVVFVFVIMLLNLPPEDLRFDGMSWGEWLLSFLGIVAAVMLGTKIKLGWLQAGIQDQGVLARFYFPEPQNMKNVAAMMFTDYLWAFELMSFLIISAIVGAVVVAKKKRREA